MFILPRQLNPEFKLGKKPIGGYKLKPDPRVTFAWMFDTATEEIRDITGRGNNAILETGTPVLRASANARSLGFDGSATGKYTVPDNSDTDPDNDSFCYVLSLTNRDASQSRNVMIKGTTDARIIISFNVGLVKFQLRTGGGTRDLASSGSIATGEPVHIVIRRLRSAETIELFLNGVEVDSVSDSIGSASNSSDMQIYTYNSGTAFDGEINHFRIVRGIVSDQEIKSWAQDEYQFLEPTTPMMYFINSGSGVTGALAETMANDTLAASSTVSYIGSVSETLADDTLSASGSIGVSGSLSETLANDTLAATTVIGYIGSLSETLADDTITSSAKLGYIGSVAETLSDDTLAANGGVGTNGYVTETLQDDTLAATGLIGLTGYAAETLQDDTLASFGTVTGTGTATPPTFQRLTVQNITIGL